MMKTRILFQLVWCVCFALGDDDSIDKILDYKFEKELKGPYNFRQVLPHIQTHNI